MKVKDFIELVNFESQRVVFKTVKEKSVLSHYDRNIKDFEDCEIDEVYVDETVATIFLKENDEK